MLYPEVDLALTTNGILLGEHLEDLKSNNVRKLNISLDTMNRQRYREITLRDYFDRVVENIDRALEEKFFDVKINAVLFRETFSELDSFLEFCQKRDLTLRFIEKMPFRKEEYDDTVVGSDELVSELMRRGILERRKERDSEVSHMYDLLYKNKDLIKIGIIPPMTHKFCNNCNRLRLTADGKLKTCLHSTHEYDLKDNLRKYGSDIELNKVVFDAIQQKQEGHKLDCYSTDGGCAALVNSRTMSKIGG